MTKGGVGDIPDKDPSDLENALPFVRSPDSTAPSVVDRCQHLSHTTEMSTGINTEEKVYRSFTRILLERLIKSLVSWIRGTPDLVLERLVNIIFSVRLDDKESSLINTMTSQKYK